MINMQYDMTKPCKECPYLSQMKGWIGSHETSLDFHNLVKQDTRMSCHLTRDCGKEQHCVGYAHYMNAMCKLSHDKNLQKLQNSIRQHRPNNLLFSYDGSELIKFHGK